MTGLALAALLFAAPASAGVSDDAQRHMVYGKTAFKEAKEAKDFQEAASEFRKALAAAPDWPDALFNLGLALEKAGDLPGALESYRRYLKADPDAKDAAGVKNRVYELEYKLEKKAKRAEDWAGTWLPARPVLRVAKNFETADRPEEAEPETLKVEISTAADGGWGARLPSIEACGEAAALRAARSEDALAFAGKAVDCERGKRRLGVGCSKLSLKREGDEVVLEAKCYRTDMPRKIGLFSKGYYDTEYEYSGPVRRAP